METPNPTIISNQEKIICPLVTVWIVFIINYILFSDDGFIHYKRIFLPSLLIIIYNLIFSIFITLSIEKNIYCLYLTGLIMSIIFVIGMIILFLFLKIYLFLKIIYILIELSLFIVLMIYHKKVKKIIKDSNINRDLLDEYQDTNYIQI